MEPRKISIIAAFVLSLVIPVAQAQLFRPLGLGKELSERKYYSFMPQMHIEDNTLYVCTNRGLYSKDLSHQGSDWQLVGFEGIPLQDYARNGDDILALRYIADSCFLLLSHDGGQTYEDITSPTLIVNKPRVTNVLLRLAQHPDDPNTLLVLSNVWGIYRSADFGKTWNKPGEVLTMGSFFGYHSARPEIIYNSGSDDIEEALINISYDNGQTWGYIGPFGHGGTEACQIAFNPFNPDQWILAAWEDMYKSEDNGHTWSSSELSQTARTFWNLTAYDSENSDIAYAVGRGEIMCSTDGGGSWLTPQIVEDVKTTAYDFKQYGDKLLIYTPTDVYVASKADLLAQSSVQNLKRDDSVASSVTYDLQGRRISRPSNGIFINNGKKVAVK